MNPTRIRGLSVRDVRFPSPGGHHETQQRGKISVPEHSCAYVILYTDSDLRGHGITYTNGGGNELVVQTIKVLSKLVVGKTLNNIFADFGYTLRFIKHESKLRSMGPEKGVTHLAIAALTNALFDLWSRLNHKPLWKFLIDMTHEELASIVDYEYIDDVLTENEVIEMLQNMHDGNDHRESELLRNGYPSYVTTTGMFGDSKEIVTDKFREMLINGWGRFKVDIEDCSGKDKNRFDLVRSVIGKQNTLMVDANQSWSVHEAVNILGNFQESHPIWIEEPTSVEDILGHAKIRKVSNSMGIMIAAGKSCQSKVIFKQFFQANAIDVCHIDSCKIGGISDALAVYLMAKKFKVPVCSHASGLGQGEMAQHLQYWDFVCLSGKKEKRFIECFDTLTNHLKFPKKIKRNHFLPPRFAGNGSELWSKSVADYEYPIGPEWKKLFSEGTYKNPIRAKPPYVASVSIEEDFIRCR